jgi:hypothetical protein
MTVSHTCNPRYTGGSQFKASPSIDMEQPYLKNTQHKKRLVE